jgi:hypothetical protein
LIGEFDHLGAELESTANRFEEVDRAGAERTQALAEGFLSAIQGISIWELLGIPEWVVELLIGLVPFGDAYDIARQLKIGVEGEEVDKLVLVLAILGLLADAGWLQPVPSVEDAPNAALAFLKAVAKQIPPGPARDAIAEMVEQAIKNPDELGRLAEVVTVLGKHGDLAETLMKHPDALVVALRNGPEAAELIARYGDDGVEFVAEYGDDGLELLRKYGPNARAVNRVLQEGQWVTRAEHMSDAARDYQRFISGRLDDKVLELGGYTFDGFDEARGVLTDAKAFPETFTATGGEFGDWVSGVDQWVAQARNQIRAADGVPIEWHFHSDAARSAMQRLFLERGIDLSRIRLIYTPMP